MNTLGMEERDCGSESFEEDSEEPQDATAAEELNVLVLPQPRIQVLGHHPECINFDAINQDNGQMLQRINQAQYHISQQQQPQLAGDDGSDDGSDGGDGGDDGDDGDDGGEDGEDGGDGGDGGEDGEDGDDGGEDGDEGGEDDGGEDGGEDGDDDDDNDDDDGDGDQEESETSGDNSEQQMTNLGVYTNTSGMSAPNAGTYLLRNVGGLPQGCDTLLASACLLDALKKMTGHSGPVTQIPEMQMLGHSYQPLQTSRNYEDEGGRLHYNGHRKQQLAVLAPPKTSSGLGMTYPMRQMPQMQIQAPVYQPTPPTPQASPEQNNQGWRHVDQCRLNMEDHLKRLTVQRLCGGMSEQDAWQHIFSDMSKTGLPPGFNAYDLANRIMQASVMAKHMGWSMPYPEHATVSHAPYQFFQQPPQVTVNRNFNPFESLLRELKMQTVQRLSQGMFRRDAALALLSLVQFIRLPTSLNIFEIAASTMQAANSMLPHSSHGMTRTADADMSHLVQLRPQHQIYQPQQYAGNYQDNSGHEWFLANHEGRLTKLTADRVNRGMSYTEVVIDLVNDMKQIEGLHPAFDVITAGSRIVNTAYACTGRGGPYPMAPVSEGNHSFPSFQSPPHLPHSSWENNGSQAWAVTNDRPLDHPVPLPLRRQPPTSTVTRPTPASSIPVVRGQLHKSKNKIDSIATFLLQQKTNSSTVGDPPSEGNSCLSADGKKIKQDVTELQTEIKNEVPELPPDVVDPENQNANEGSDFEMEEVFNSKQATPD